MKSLCWTLWLLLALLSDRKCTKKPGVECRRINKTHINSFLKSTTPLCSINVPFAEPGTDRWNIGYDNNGYQSLNNNNLGQLIIHNLIYNQSIKLACFWAVALMERSNLFIARQQNANITAGKILEDATSCLHSILCEIEGQMPRLKMRPPML